MAKTRTRRSYRPAKADVYYYRGFEIRKSKSAHDRERWCAHGVVADQPIGGLFATHGAVMRAIDVYRDRPTFGIDFAAVEARVMAAQAAAFAEAKRREVGVVCGLPYHFMHGDHRRLLEQMRQLERDASPVFIVDVEGRSNPQLIMGHPDQAPPFLIPPAGHQYITDADVRELEARLLRKEPLVQVPPSSPGGKTCLGPDFLKTTNPETR